MLCDVCVLEGSNYPTSDPRRNVYSHLGMAQNNSIQFNSIKFISTFIHHYMSIIIIIHCIFLNEKSKWICRKLNKLIRDIPGITHNQFT